jgi:hypothetical protein
MTLANLHKLATREDARFLHLHKTLGVVAAAHFAWRLWLGATTGSLGLDDGPWTLAAVALHSALSLTSLQFHLPANRVKGRPMIWPEARLHSIGFTLRSTAVLAVFVARWRLGWSAWMEAARGAAVIATMLWADAASSRFGPGPDDTTMRKMPYPDAVPLWYRPWHTLFYSVGQVCATASMLLSCRAETPFLVLVPIQVSVFLMTLVRKGILSSAGWHAAYTATVLAPFVYHALAARVADPSDPPVPYVAVVAAFCVLRFRFRVDKYVLWVPVVLAHSYVSIAHGVYRMGGL